MENGKLADLNTRIINYEKMFNTAFSSIVDELVKEDEKNEEIKSAAVWLRESLNYNTFDGKKSRGKMVIGTVDFLRGGKPTDDEVKKAIYLGMYKSNCLEDRMLVCHFID